VPARLDPAQRLDAHACEPGELALREAGRRPFWVQPCLPAYSQDGTTAFLRISFGPTPHGACALYLVRKRSEGWRVEWRALAY
jgi:hypothetical protein